MSKKKKRLLSLERNPESQKDMIQIYFVISLASLGYINSVTGSISDVIKMAEENYKEVIRTGINVKKNSFLNQVPLGIREDAKESVTKIVALFGAIRLNPPPGYSVSAWGEKMQGFINSAEAIALALNNANPIKKQVSDYLERTLIC